MRAFPGTVGRALLLLILIVLLPLLAAQAVIYYAWFQAQRAAELNANLEVAHSVAAAFESFVEGLHRHQLALGVTLLNFESRPQTEYVALLALSATEYPAVHQWYWLDSQGRILATTHRGRTGLVYPDFERLARGPASGLGDLRAESGDRFLVWRRVENESGVMLGIVVSEVHADKLGDLVLQVYRAHGGICVLFDRQGRIAYRYPRVASLEHQIWRDRDRVLLAAMETGREQTGVYDSPLFGDRRFAARVPVESLGWTAGAGRAVELAFKPALRSLWLVGGVNALVVVLCIAGAGLLGRRIVGRLRVLQEHARQFGQGHFDRRVDLGGFEELVELAELGDRFNEMAEQLQQRAAAIDTAMEELRRSNRELEQFAYVASHDLQEPLRVIIGYLQLIERRYRNKLDAEGEEFIGFIVDAVKRMQALIADLLEYSRVGTRGRPFASTDADEVLHRAVEALSRTIVETGAQVTHDPLPTVCVDDLQLMQLFQNLIGNALKFHGPQRPQVHVSAQPEADGWRFTVRDNGIGIEPQYREQIFVIFQRLHTRDKYPGTGIGLAICKKIVERHGGRIWVDSTPGGGSTFHFTIPNR